MYLPKLSDPVLNENIYPGKVFDLTLPLDQLRRPTALWTSDLRSRRCFAPGETG